MPTYEELVNELKNIIEIASTKSRRASENQGEYLKIWLDCITLMVDIKDCIKDEGWKENE